MTESKLFLCPFCRSMEIKREVNNKAGKSCDCDICGDKDRIGLKTQFSTGAVRDTQQGKGRFDLIPLDVIEELTEDPIFLIFKEVLELKGETSNGGKIYECLKQAANVFVILEYDGIWYKVLLELSKRFEYGAEKYGERNWEKGLPLVSYFNSALRHYCKYKAGETDEPHDIAFIWNCICGASTVQKSVRGYY